MYAVELMVLVAAHSDFQCLFDMCQFWMHMLHLGLTAVAVVQHSHYLSFPSNYLNNDREFLKVK